MNRSFLTTTDLTVKEIFQIFHVAKRLKTHPLNNRLNKISMAMIFQKPSTRTRVSFEVGMTQLGGHALNLGTGDLQLSRGETIADTARVIGRYADIIMARVFAHSDIIELAKYAGVPVINGLSDLYHPCQVLADMFTLWERKKKLTGLTLTYVGDGDNNITNSLGIVAAQLGMHYSVGCPMKYMMQKSIIDEIHSIAKKNRVKFKITTDPVHAVRGADIVATDVWVSMGRTDRDDRLKALQSYQLNRNLLSFAKKNAIVLHCLPAHRGEEITEDIIDGPQSVVFDEAENRLHVQKALILKLMGR